MIEAEAQLERTAGEEDVLEKAADLVCSHAPFRDDVWATPEDRRRTARSLARRALRSALERGRRREALERPRSRPLLPHRAPAPLPYFTSGRLELSVNGRTLRADAEARTTLLDLLRGAGIFGVKAGCSMGRCGACTVLLDGRPVASCLTLAVRAQGRTVLTIEGLGTAERPHRLQTAFAEAGASQCGFCTPGLVLEARALLEAIHEPERGRDQGRARGPLPMHGLRAPDRGRPGRRSRRRGGSVSLRRATGQAAFAGDILLPGTLHLALRRSPLAHARVAHTNVSAARLAPRRGAGARRGGRGEPPLARAAVRGRPHGDGRRGGAGARPACGRAGRHRPRAAPGGARCRGRGARPRRAWPRGSRPAPETWKEPSPTRST